MTGDTTQWLRRAGGDQSVTRLERQGSRCDWSPAGSRRFKKKTRGLVKDTELGLEDTELGHDVSRIHYHFGVDTAGTCRIGIRIPGTRTFSGHWGHPQSRSWPRKSLTAPTVSRTNDVAKIHDVGNNANFIGPTVLWEQ